MPAAHRSPVPVPIRATDGRTFEALLVEPDTSNGRGLVVLPEVYNVNAWARRVAARYAAHGFTVLLPDLFWRQQAGRHFEYDQPEPARAQGQAVDVDAVVTDVGALAAALRDRLGAGAAVGIVGYCLGGRLAALAGIREPVDAIVSYYGVQLDQHLDELPRLTIPALFHFGDEDPWVPEEVVSRVDERLRDHPNVAIHRYAAGHGFDRDGHPPYSPAAAGLAFDRSLRLLNGGRRPLSPDAEGASDASSAPPAPEATKAPSGARS